MKKYTSFNRLVLCKKENINDNWYYVMVWPETNTFKEKYLTVVKAYDDGREMKYMSPYDVESTDMKTYGRNKQNKVNDISKFVSETLNSAICNFEKKKEKENDLKNKIEIAIESNKEIHD